MRASILLIALFAACSHDHVSGPPSGSGLATITISPDTPEIVRGQTAALTAVLRDGAGKTVSGVPVKWSSSSAAIALVDATGLVRGITPGQARIQAAAEGKTAETVVTVTYPARDSAAVGTDSTVVSIGRGSSIVIPAGTLPSGTKVLMQEEPTSNDSVAGTPLGPRLRIVLTSPPSSATRSQRAGTADLVDFPVALLHYRTKITQPISEIRDQVSAVISDAADIGKGIAATGITVAESVGEFGDHILDATVVVPLQKIADQNVVQYVVTFGIGEKHCTDDTWAFYRVSADPPSTNKIPLVLVHGWQPDMVNCNQARQFFPEAKTWQTILAAVQANPALRARYDVYVFRYPTFYPVKQSAAQFAVRTQVLGSRARVVVAHSMGGLVAARYMVDADPDYIPALLTLGTPFGGSELAKPLSLSTASRSVLSPLALTALVHPILGSAGQGDLVPESQFITQLDADGSKFSTRLDSYAGVLSSAIAPKLMTAGRDILAAIGQSPSDGVVWRSSTTAAGSRISRSFDGVDHLSLPSSPIVTDTLLHRLQALAAEVPTAPRTLLVYSGTGQTGKAGAPLGHVVAVQVMDSAGVRVPGVAVSFAPHAGNGTVSPSVAITNSVGIAEAIWTLGPGIGTQQLDGLAAGLNTVTFSATATAADAPAIGLSDTLVAFTAVSEGAGPADKTVQVTNAGGGTLSGLTLGAITYDSAPTGWLTATLAGSVSPTNIVLSVTHGTLGAGTYGATVPVRSTAAGVSNSPQAVRVRLTVLPQGTPGVLRLNLTAISDSFYANVAVSGPNGFSQSEIVSPTGPKLINNLAPGTYSTSWSDAVCVYQGGCGPVSFGPAVREQAAVVNSGFTTSLSSMYLPITGYMVLKATGLNDSVYVRVDISGPAAYSNTIALGNGDSLRLPNLKPGTYTIGWHDSTCAYQGGCARTFHPASRNQQVELVASTEPLSISMAYSP